MANRTDKCGPVRQITGKEHSNEIIVIIHSSLSCEHNHNLILVLRNHQVMAIHVLMMMKLLRYTYFLLTPV